MSQRQVGRLRRLWTLSAVALALVLSTGPTVASAELQRLEEDF